MAQLTKNRIQFVVGRTVTYLVLLAAVVSVLLPFEVVVSTSFRKTTSIYAYPPEWIPKKPTTENYVGLLSKYLFPRWFLNSVVVVISIVVLKVIIDSLAGYAFAKGNFKGKELIFAVMLATMMVPFAVTLLPTFFIIRDLKLVDTYLGLILPPLANPLGIFMMRQYIQTISSDLIDAARVDGCSEFGVYWRIVLPVSAPGLLSLATVVFITSWVSFIWPLVVIQSEEMKILTVAIPALRGIWVTNWGLISAASTLTIVPVVILFAVMNKYFVAGIRMGAHKG